jgi:CMP-N-acetylneuraminic acid synthetase
MRKSSIDHKKVLAIIPARGGSKGVRRKNIRSVAGEPLIYWTIKASLEANTELYIYVNTDDDEIANISIEKGVEVLERPSELAQDKTPMLPALQDACRRAELKHGTFDAVLLLQPTAPFRLACDIDGALLSFFNNKADSLVSVYQVEDCHPSRMYRMTGGYLEKIYNEPIGSLRQDLEPIYHRNGAIYLCSRNLLMERDCLLTNDAIPYVMPKERSHNIDDEDDLLIADLLMTHKIRAYENIDN